MDFQGTYKIADNKIIIRLRDKVCDSAEELLSSELFNEILRRYLKDLSRRESPFLRVFGEDHHEVNDTEIRRFIQMLHILSKLPIDAVPKLVEGGEVMIKDPSLLNSLVENLYNYWREHQRFIICDSKGDVLDKRPYRTFNTTIESLTHLVRQVYREIEENITGNHPQIYRQVRAGAEVAVIAMPKDISLPGSYYKKLHNIPVIRQILLYPPLLINQPINKRTGQFERININPLDLIDFDPDEWVCYPAKVGTLLILIYVHERFLELGLSLCNLFELADDDFLDRDIDAVYFYGAPGGGLDKVAPMPTVFYDNESDGPITAACPNDDKYGYFGYLKKMVLTLHNIKVMKSGRLPFHGAMVRIVMKGDRTLSVLVVGDTGAGKSETLEAFRIIGGDRIKDMVIIADDMGSLEIDASGMIIGYGTEVGAFVRLDDLQPGYAFGQLDRAILMNPSEVNSRVVLPVTTYENIIKGYQLDMILYANNYEEIDEEHPIIERIDDPGTALRIFREGTAMSKGTTTSTGLVHTYFVNVFGPVQYKALHDGIAKRYFEAFFNTGIFVGQMRTRLGISGWERKGPEAAAAALMKMVFGD